MVFRISRLRIIAADDAGFSDLVSALPDGAERLAERRCPGDKVQWQDYVGVYLRDAADDQAEIDIAGRVYRVQRSELGPVGP